MRLWRNSSLMTAALVLGGCALPVPIQIASWAIDGISYIATQKSIADHGISMVAGRDCAVHRVLTEGDICGDKAYDGPVLAGILEAGEPSSIAGSESDETYAAPIAIAALEQSERNRPDQRLLTEIRELLGEDSRQNLGQNLGMYRIRPGMAMVAGLNDREAEALGAFETAAGPSAGVESRESGKVTSSAFPEGPGLVALWQTGRAELASVENAPIGHVGDQVTASDLPAEPEMHLPEGRHLMAMWDNRAPGSVIMAKAPVPAPVQPASPHLPDIAPVAEAPADGVLATSVVVTSLGYESSGSSDALAEMPRTRLLANLDGEFAGSSSGIFGSIVPARYTARSQYRLSFQIEDRSGRDPPGNPDGSDIFSGG